MKQIGVFVSVPDDWESRLDMQPYIVTEIEADRWLWEWADRDAMRRLKSELDLEQRARTAFVDRIAALEAENVCDSCLGNGNPVSGKPCMCGGTGKMSDAARYLREQLVKERGEVAALRQQLSDDKISKFYWRHALGPMMRPSCLVCGCIPKTVAIKHAELPGIVVCEGCRNARAEVDTLREDADELRDKLRRLSKLAPNAARYLFGDTARKEPK